MNFRFVRVEDAKALQHYEDLCNENNEYDIIPLRNQFKDMEAYFWHREKQLGNGMVPSSLYVLEDKGEILGTLVIRHRLNDFLELYIGHIGYRVSPCHRQKGVCCLADNVAFMKTIQHCKGKFYKQYRIPETKQTYVIFLIGGIKHD